MAIEYTIDPAANVLTMTLSGEVTVQDFGAYFERTQSDPAFNTGLHRLIVIRGVRSFPTSAQVGLIASRIRTRTSDPSIRLAAVADTPLGRGMTAMFMGTAGLGDRYETFDDVTSAVAWLVGAARARFTQSA